MPWATEDLALRAFRALGYHCVYLNLSPTPDIICQRTVETNDIRLGTVILIIEVKGINKPNLSAQQFDALVKLKNSISSCPFNHSWALVAVVGNGRIKVYNAVDVIEDDDSDCFYKENGVMYFDTTCLREIAEISLDGLRLRCPQWFMGDYKALFRLGQCPINRARSLRASYLAPRLGPRCSIMPIATNLITVGWA